MVRSAPRSAPAVAAARKVQGLLKAPLCCVNAVAVLKEKRHLRIRTKGVSDEAFHKALNRVGARKQRVQVAGVRMKGWCINCDHTVKEVQGRNEGNS